MSRKDYELMAKTLGEVYNDDAIDLSLDGLNKLIAKFCIIAKLDNPHFNEDVFKERVFAHATKGKDNE